MSAIWDRLTQQLMEKGYPNARQAAKDILIKQGNLNEDGTDTEQGYIRGAMTPEDRALDRQVRYRGEAEEDYEYNESSNTCRKRRKPFGYS